MVAVSEAVAVPRAHFLLRGHQQPATRGEQALPDDGAAVEEDYEERSRQPTG